MAALCWGAVGFAVHGSHVLRPGAYGFAVLKGHDSSELMKMIEVVGGPGGEQLRKSDGAERRVVSGSIEVLLLQIEGTQLG